MQGKQTVKASGLSNYARQNGAGQIMGSFIPNSLAIDHTWAPFGPQLGSPGLQLGPSWIPNVTQRQKKVGLLGGAQNLIFRVPQGAQ